jgi:hypothetical protein
MVDLKFLGVGLIVAACTTAPAFPDGHGHDSTADRKEILLAERSWDLQRKLTLSASAKGIISRFDVRGEDPKLNVTIANYIVTPISRQGITSLRLSLDRKGIKINDGLGAEIYGVEIDALTDGSIHLKPELKVRLYGTRVEGVENNSGVRPHETPRGTFPLSPELSVRVDDWIDSFRVVGRGDFCAPEVTDHANRPNRALFYPDGDRYILNGSESDRGAKSYVDRIDLKLENHVRAPAGRDTCLVTVFTSSEPKRLEPR